MNQLLFALVLLNLLGLSASFALEVGDQAPGFSALSSDGINWESSSLLGKKHLIVYFYPAAMTGGCTKQACAYSDHEKKWRSRGVEVIAISGDSPENLNLFKKAENLNLTLLSDPQGKIAKTFGVPTGKGGQIERVVNGEKVTLKRGVTAKRWTFVVSKQGKILFVNDRVNAAQDSSSLLSLFKEKNLK